MSVAVVSKTGMLLMPTSEYRARKPLKSKKAIIHGYHPFTIQLTERDTVSHGSITESGTTDGLLRPWNIRRPSISRRFHVSAK